MAHPEAELGLLLPAGLWTSALLLITLVQLLPSHRRGQQPPFPGAEKQESESLLFRKVSEFRSKESNKSGEVKSKKKMLLKN